MTRRVAVLIFAHLLLAAPLHAQDDMQEKIRQLELQIQELKVLKARSDLGRQKSDQCLQAVGREKFCTCIGDNLPVAVSFEQYIHTMVTSKQELGYSSMPPEQKKTVDAILETREKCVEKGFFK